MREQHDIARHQVAGWHDGFLRVAKHAPRAPPFVSAPRAPARPMLLDEPEQHREQDDDRDHDGLEGVTEESRYGGRREQDQKKKDKILTSEGEEEERAVRYLQLVRAVGAEALRRLIPVRPVRPAESSRSVSSTDKVCLDRGTCIGRRHSLTPHPAPHSLPGGVAGRDR